MSATAQASRPASLNRRRRVRQKVHAPAYATFRGDSNTEMLDLYEVLDISEVGVSLQCASPMEIDKQLELSLDLAEARGQINAIARVVWSDSSGRVGLGLAPLPDSTLHHFREWLFLNAMAGAANAASAAASVPPQFFAIRPSYTDTLTAATAVQREAESLGTDLEAILTLIAFRSQSLLRASGAAIALAPENLESPVVEKTIAEKTIAEIMTCRASAGPSAPPVGATLQVGAGFSGECVRTGNVSRCDDTESDECVDRQSCRALGIRSMLAAPLRSDEKVIGLLEVFSAQPRAFDEGDSAVLQRFAETIVAAVNRAASTNHPAQPPPAPEPFKAAPGSVLFAHPPAESSETKNASANEGEDKVGGVHLPRAHLYLLICAAATIALALGFILAPWIQPWIQDKLHARERSGEQTVLASSRPSADTSQSSSVAIDPNNFAQLSKLAMQGDPAGENALGLLYAQGDEKQAVKPDDAEAAAWFTKAAEHGNISAQYKLGLLYWGGHHGLPKDANKAYFWTVLARAGGQPDSKDLAKVLANGMTRSQAAAIEQQAELWYQQHESHAKPSPGR